MALPKIDNPTYTLELPSTGEVVKYRPFLVKEQKVLMLAQQSDKAVDRNNAIVQIIESCTFGKVDAIVSPIFDIEYVFLQLRMRSVGAKVKLNVICPDDEKTEAPVEINLEDVNVLNDEKHTNIVNVTNTVKMVMGYPRLADIKAMKNTTDNIFQLLMKCIVEVHDGDTIHNRTDVSDKELAEFVDSFNTEQLQSLMQFFETMPKVRHVINVTNPNTKVTSEMTLEGMETFLV